MTDRTLRISARLAEEIRQWASDELGMWPRDTAYAADLESLLAQIAANPAEQPADLQLSASKVGSAPQDQTGVSTAPDAAPTGNSTLMEALMTARDYVSDASMGALVNREQVDITKMAAEDLARIDATLAKGHQP